MGNQNRQGLVHLYVGDGKGKTTATVGLAVRALGVGQRVLFAQFLKTRASGELEPLVRLGAQLMRAKGGDKFVFQMDAEELARSKADHGRMLRDAAAVMASGGADLVILDEAVDAVNAGVIDGADLVQAVRSRAPHVEVVLSGRNPSPEIADLADYHTDFRCVRHPYQKGVAARVGIEF